LIMIVTKLQRLSNQSTWR